MKVLYMHAKNLEIHLGKGKSPKRIREFGRRIERKQGMKLEHITDKNRVTTSNNALLAFVCAEKGDEKLTLGPVAKSILDARVLVAAEDIVIGSFGHLSTSPADPRVSKTLIETLIGIVAQEYEKTKTYPFGWDKGVKIEIPCHPMNMSFKSFEPN